MDTENKRKLRDEEVGEVSPTDNSTRARNRTVMLSPEITGNVRARLSGEVPGEVFERSEVVPHPGQALNQEWDPTGSEDHTSTTLGYGHGSDSLDERPTWEPKHTSVHFEPEVTPFGRAENREVDPVKYEQIVWKTPGQVVGFLVSYDSDPLGSFFELRKGRLLVTSAREAFASCLVVNHDTVSVMHAILCVGDDGSVQVLDQLSEHGTYIIRSGAGLDGGESQEGGEEVVLSGDKAHLQHGDIVSFGERKFHVCLVAT